MSRSRSYVYTYNNYTQEDEDRLQLIPCAYHVYGREVAPSTGTPHLQGFIYFRLQKSFSAVRKILGSCHIEVCVDLGRAIQYAKKDGNFWENGTPPKTPKEKGEAGKQVYEAAWELAKQGRIEEISEPLRTRFFNTYKRIQAEYQVQPPSQPELDFHWYYGPSGAGKSLKARQDNPSHFLKLPNKWWDGYKGQPCVIIDEWSPSHSVLADHLKRWADHHPFAAEIKGGTVCIRPPRIIITSNYSIDECFPGEENAPLRRRFKTTHFNKLH